MMKFLAYIVGGIFAIFVFKWILIISLMLFVAYLVGMR